MDVLFWLIMGAGYLFSLGVQQTSRRKDFGLTTSFGWSF